MIIKSATGLLLIAGAVLYGSLQLCAQNLFEERVQSVLRAAGEHEERNLYVVTAKLVNDADDENALEQLRDFADDQLLGGMFFAYQMIGTYLFTRDRLPDDLKDTIRRAYRDRTMYRGDTENHWVMYYTGLYLAAQTWPDMDGMNWFNGKSSSANFNEAEGWLYEWFRITTTIGQGEFDSPTYLMTFLNPMLLLYEFAEDPEMKKKSEMILDYLFADYAVKNLRGNYGGGHSRDYPQDIINPLTAPNIPWSWLYLGEPDFLPWDNPMGEPRHSGWNIVFAALSSYRLPDIIYSIATDRSAPYVLTETKRTRNIIRFAEQRNLPVYKYTYMTDSFVLGSLHGGILQPIQQHTWDVTFVSEKPYNTIFTLHPYYSGRELAMFFPEQQKFLADEVDRYHKVYTDPDKWNASSPYEQTMQYENAIIVLYNIEPGAHHPHIDGFFPKNLDKRIELDNRWILSRAGTVYIAVYPLKEYEWIEEEVNFRFRSYDLRNGVVVEVGTQSEYDSFEKFIEHFSAAEVSYSETGGSPQVRYITRNYDTLEFTFDGERIVNGDVVRFEEYRLFNSPYLRSDIENGIVEIIYGDKKRTLDFNTNTITENNKETSDYILHCAVLFSVPDEASTLGYAHPARSVGLFRRKENGSWTNMHHPNLFSYGLGYSRHGDTFRLYIAGGNGLHRSSDEGNSWKILTGWRTEDILSIATHPNDSTIMYVSTPLGVFGTIDDGETWMRKMNGMKRWYVQRIIIDNQSPETLYAASEDDAYVSRDGGESWEPLDIGVPEILEIVQHPAVSDIVLVGTEDHGVYVTHDGGRTWIAGKNIPETALYAIAFSSDGRDVYAGGYQTGLWRSTDNGLVWERVMKSEDVEAIYAITVHPNNNNHIVIGTNGKGLFESFDGGETWQHAGLYGAHIQQIKFIPRY
jgi:photosystem II stability/assembly factor-like uncharacterized protein